MTRGNDLLQDAMQQLDGWSTEPNHISRTLTIDESQHADLTERIKVFADAFELRPHVRRRNGCTEIDISRDDGVTLSEVSFAARIEDAYQNITGTTRETIGNSKSTGRFRSWWGLRPAR